jgi:hypothetical protein
MKNKNKDKMVNEVTFILFSILIVLLTPFMYAKLVGDTFSLIIFMYETLLFAVSLIIYSYITDKPQYTIAVIWIALFLISMAGTYSSSIGSYGHAAYRVVILVGAFFLELYLVVMIAIKDKLAYKIIFPLLFVSLVFVFVWAYLEAGGATMFLFPQEVWLWHNIIYPLFHVPNT